ncbi:MAG: CHC2 zinc finger domain-containing protein [Candidatus Micrarchaeia archaeon]
MEKLIKALIQSLSQDHFDLICDLRIKLLNLEREILPYPEDDGICISPEWNEIGCSRTYSQEKSPAEATRDFRRYCKEKRSGDIRVKKKKASKSILSVLERYNVKMKSKMILCPFHLERTPSCRIYFETDTFYCFGCGKYGTADDLEQALRGEK